MWIFSLKQKKIKQILNIFACVQNFEILKKLWKVMVEIIMFNNEREIFTQKNMWFLYGIFLWDFPILSAIMFMFETLCVKDLQNPLNCFWQHNYIFNCNFKYFTYTIFNRYAVDMNKMFINISLYCKYCWYMLYVSVQVQKPCTRLKWFPA